MQQQQAPWLRCRALMRLATMAVTMPAASTAERMEAVAVGEEGAAAGAHRGAMGGDGAGAPRAAAAVEVVVAEEGEAVEEEEVVVAAAVAEQEQSKTDRMAVGRRHRAAQGGRVGTGRATARACTAWGSTRGARRPGGAAACGCCARCTATDPASTTAMPTARRTAASSRPHTSGMSIKSDEMIRPTQRQLNPASV